MAITNNGAANSLPASRLPSGYTRPTVTGGSPNEPFVDYIDIHYQSTNMPTKQKASPFWT